MNEIDKKDIKLVAITGSIGAGKTTAAKYIESLGFPVVYTDELAKFVMNNNVEVIDQLKNVFGESIYDEKNVLDSKLLSKLIFDNCDKGDDKLARLNAIVHPPTIDMMIKEIEKLIENDHKLIFVESALIYEASLQDGFDYVIVIDAPENIRLERSANRLKLSVDEIRKRNCKQISTETKKEFADFVIENTGNIEQLHKSVDLILSIIKMA